MYIPEHFALSDQAAQAMLATAAAGELVTSGPDGLEATRLPFAYDPDAGSLITHMARVNPQWQRAGSAALVILGGPEGYVSSEWMLTGDAVSVPSWDYITLHVYGTLVVHTERREILDGLDVLTRAFGAAYHDDLRSPTMPRDALDRLLPAIVGVEVHVERLEAKAKMSQNKPPEQVARIADGFAMAGNKAAATWLRETSLPRALAKQRLLADIAADARATEGD